MGGGERGYRLHHHPVASGQRRLLRLPRPGRTSGGRHLTVDTGASGPGPALLGSIIRVVQSVETRDHPISDQAPAPGAASDQGHRDCDIEIRSQLTINVDKILVLCQL